MENTQRGDGQTNSAMSNTTAGNINKASSSAHAAIGSIAEAAERKAKPAIDRMASMAHQAVDKAADVAAPAADWLAQKSEGLSSTQKKLVENTSTYVSAHPIKAVAIALVAGFLLSRIIL